MANATQSSMDINFLNASSQPQNDVTYNLFGAVGYVVMGFMSSVSNFCIFFSIVKYSALRELNQYTLLMFLSLADAVNMLAYFVAGLYRIAVMMHAELQTPLTARQCLLRPHVFLWILADKFSHLLLVFLSLDRLFLVSAPQFYLLRLPSPHYALFLAFLAFLITNSMSLMSIIAILIQPPIAEESPHCYFPTIVGSGSWWAKVYVYYERNISSAFALGSVVIFAAILPIYKCRNTTNSDLPAEMERQKKMTKSLAISCVCTLCLLCVPYKLLNTFWEHGYYFLSWLMTHISLANCLANLWIYQLSLHDMRVALRGLLCCKQMPVMLSLWPKTDGEESKPQSKRGSKVVARSRPATQQHVREQELMPNQLSG